MDLEQSRFDEARKQFEAIENSNCDPVFYELARGLRLLTEALMLPKPHHPDMVEVGVRNGMVLRQRGDQLDL